MKNEILVKRCRIAFISQENPIDKRTWSGITYNLFSQIEKFHSVTWLHANDLSITKRRILSIWNRAANFLNWKFTNHYFLNSYFLSNRIQKKIAKENFDVAIVGAGESELIAYLKTSIPVIYIADTTFNNMIDYYPWHTGLCKLAIKQGNSIERNAIEKAKHIIFSSSWAAASAINYYGANQNKISIIEFGANLQRLPLSKDIFNKRPGKKCNLLFIGVQWERKGGALAHSTFLELKKRNVECNLTIVGCDPGITPNADLQVIRFLDKNKTSDFEKLYKIFIDTDFLILPTKADCTPIVFCEAAAFGIPVLTTNTGGISSIIKEGKNGFCFSVADNEKKYSDLIESLWSNPQTLIELYQSSRKEFDERLNWETWIKKVNQIIMDCIPTGHN